MLGPVITNKKFRLTLETHQLLTGTTETTGRDEYSLYCTQGHGATPPILVTLRINGQDLTMELDTGATLSIVSEKTYQSLFSPDAAPELKTSKAKLKTYTEEALNILGEITVTVNYRNQVTEQSLLVVAGDGPSLLGCDWLSHLKLDWK